MYMEDCNCNLCGTVLQRVSGPSSHGKFTMCGDCANTNRGLLVRHSLLKWDTNVQGGITWLVLTSIDKLKQLFPNPLSMDEDFWIPAPDSGGAGDDEEDIPPTLKHPADIDQRIDNAIGAARQLANQVCKKHYYGVGDCICGKGRR